jgi:hypothetical protein
MDVYLEGGAHLRRPMRNFLRRAVGNDINIDVDACRSRDRAIARFGRVSSPDSLLLIDSEGDDLHELRQTVASRARLLGVLDRTFFMVQLMEAWFLADRETLQAYYGPRFNPRILPNNPQPEVVLKGDVINRLSEATRGTPKRIYHKTAHAPALLNLLNPTAVYNTCPNFRSLVDFLRN